MTDADQPRDPAEALAGMAELRAALKDLEAWVYELEAVIAEERERSCALGEQLMRSENRVDELLRVVDLRDHQILQLAQEIHGLHESRERRGVIEQAKGMIMMTMQCSADAAFAVLVAQSTAENRKLHEVASEVVAMHDRQLPPEDPHT